MGKNRKMKLNTAVTLGFIGTITSIMALESLQNCSIGRLTQSLK